MGHEQDGPAEAGQCLLDLFDGGDVEMVGGLVEHQEVDLAGLEHGQLGPGPFAR